MKFYLAPMEGLTGFVFRNAYQKHFGNIDTYFTPFINNKKMNNNVPIIQFLRLSAVDFS